MVMATWCEDAPRDLKKEESIYDEESLGFEGGYSSNRGHSRHSQSWQSGMLRDKTLGRGKKSDMESEEEMEEDGDNSDGHYKDSAAV
jgi:hypothetical protein